MGMIEYKAFVLCITTTWGPDEDTAELLNALAVGGWQLDQLVPLPTADPRALAVYRRVKAGPGAQTVNVTFKDTAFKPDVVDRSKGGVG